MAEEKKLVTIIVEGTPHEWPKNENISFDQVVIWVYSDYSPSDGRAYTVTFEKGDNEKPCQTYSPLPSSPRHNRPASVVPDAPSQ